MVLHKLNKRELVSYYLLLRSGTLNIGEAVDLLSERLCMTKRTARRVIKRLKRLSLVNVEVKEDSLLVKARGLEEVLTEVSEGYIESRQRRCHALAKREPVVGGQEPG